MKINKETSLFGSFSKNPGNNGCIYFNKRFKHEGLNAIYKSFYGENLDNIILSIKTLNFKGFAMSMPFKLEVLKYVDELDPSVNEIGAANTITNQNGYLKAFNTDWIGVERYLKENKVTSLSILGDGGFSKAVQYCCKINKINYEIFNRKNWHKISKAKYLTFNATPADIRVDIDGRPFTSSGKQIALYQAEEQFKIYKNQLTNSNEK